MCRVGRKLFQNTLSYSSKVLLSCFSYFIQIYIFYFELYDCYIQSMKHTSKYILFTFVGLLVLYILALLYVTLLPDFWAGGILEMDASTPRPLVKLRLLDTFFESLELGILTFLIQVGGNLLLLVPLGIVSGVMRRGWIWVVWVSILIELSQLLLSLQLGFVYRTFDVDDLWMNSLGGFLGYLVSRKVWYNRKNN